jgi:uncharacterized membrane protein (UPF0127 family)
MDTGTVHIVTATDTVPMPVEIARTEQERSYGLMERTNLPADAGMLFVATEPQDSTRGFYMFRTRIPLDIAFLDANGRILSIMTMEPCTSPQPSLCYVYSPGLTYYNALEANQGYFARNNITTGDQVIAPE